MAVIEGTVEICTAVHRQMEERRSEGQTPTKVLISQRQLDALCRALEIKSWERVPTRLWGLPVVICPDCDLYVVAVKDPGPSRIREGLLPTRTVEKHIGGRFS